jgi:hypothetical protein
VKPQDPRKWNSEQVADWLKSIYELSSFASAFVAKRVSGRLLSKLSRIILFSKALFKITGFAYFTINFISFSFKTFLCTQL